MKKAAEKGFCERLLAMAAEKGCSAKMVLSFKKSIFFVPNKFNTSYPA